jgi:hypothetical protein
MSATTKDPKYPGPRIVWLGDPPGDMERGTTFEIPINCDVRLEEISLAIGHRAGKDELDVRIVPDCATRRHPPQGCRHLPVAVYCSARERKHCASRRRACLRI